MMKKERLIKICEQEIDLIYTRLKRENQALDNEFKHYKFNEDYIAEKADMIRTLTIKKAYWLKQLHQLKSEVK